MTMSAFAPFKMPDFKSRPEGESQSLKNAYICLRRQGFPDKDIFIYPLGEFSKFKGEILNQKPDPDDIVSSGDRVILLVNKSGICDQLPDLFIDHAEDFFADDFSKRTGARRLFAIFDSVCLKMMCRLEWIRDIYSGLYLSKNFMNYFDSLLLLPEFNKNQQSPEILGYVIPKLYNYLGTESAIKVYLEAVLGLKVDVSFKKLQAFDLEKEVISKLNTNSYLGQDMYLGESFNSTYPILDIVLYIDNSQSIEEIVPEGKTNQLLINIIKFCLPYHSEKFSITIKPISDDITFISGESYLGYSSKIRAVP